MQGVVEARFNQHHARARSIIERASGMMKNRYCNILAIFNGSLHLCPQSCCTITMLHNLCLATGDEEDPLHQEEDETEDRPPHQECNGMTIRAQLAAQVHIQLDDYI